MTTTTETETGTFSALIDEAKLRSGRADRAADLIAYARSSMRECTVLARFQQNLIEGTFTVGSTIPHIFKRPVNMRQWQAIQYPYFDSHGQPVFVEEKRPSKFQTQGTDYWFYLTGDSYVFNGLAVGDLVKYAYHSYLTKLTYYSVIADRPARYIIESETWEYHADYIGNTELNDTGEAKVSNWLLFYWYDLILEGTLAKLYKTVGDTRQSASYALYKQQQKDLLAGESQVIVRS